MSVLRVIAAILLLAVAALADPPASQSQARDEDLRWRMPLAEKADVIQADIYRNHMAAGQYIVEVSFPYGGAGPSRPSPQLNMNVSHTSSWTGVYLLGAGFRVGWARKTGDPRELAAALDLGGKLLGGIDLLTHVSGIPGYLARGAEPGHGPTREERLGHNERNESHQGKGKYAGWRWRGNPSHHNYHHVMRGLGVYYYHLQHDNPTPSARERAQMDSVRAIVAAMANYAYKAHDGVITDVDGEIAVSFFRPSDRPTTYGIMATNSLKISHWITGDSWYGRKYDEMTRAYGYRRENAARGLDADHDDTEHTFGSLWLVHEIETDPALKRFYGEAVTALFQSKRNDRWAFYNYIYAGTTGDVPGADLPGALSTMRRYPSNSVSYAYVNSIRTDIEFVTDARGVRRPKNPLPYNDVPIDGGGWKGQPYTLDRWTSRPIVAFAASAEDSVVWALADSDGRLYRSYDGGKTFAVAEFRHDAARIRDIAFAGGKSRFILLATDKGVYRTATDGFDNRWSRVLGGPENAAREIIVDPSDPFTAWAVMDDGVWRSVNLERENTGLAWNKIDAPMPAGAPVVWGVRPGPDPSVWAAIGGRIYRRGLRDAGWTMAERDLEGYHIIPTVRQIAVAPGSPEKPLVVTSFSVWGQRWPILLRSDDGGKTFGIVGFTIPPDEDDAPTASAGSGLEGIELANVVVDPHDPRYIYGASASAGFLRSTDGGTTWRRMNEGLRIPSAYRVFAPRETPGTLFISTPAGFHTSADRGATWSRPLVTMNAFGVERMESGGYAYIVAYWPARYFGFLSDEEVRRLVSAWDGE